MTTMTRTAQTVAGLPGVGAISRTLRAPRRGSAAERAERRRVAREIASYPATRGVCITVTGRHASR